MKQPSTARVAAAVGCLALLVAACGTRVDDDIRRQAAAAALGAGSGVGSGPGFASDGTTDGALPGTDDGTGAGPLTPGGDDGGIGTPAPAEGNGGATDIGVTEDSIILGNVSDLSGPVPGLFEGAVNGTLAYLSYVNSQGGIFGRTLKLKSADGRFDCQQNQSQHRELIPQVFAFVGSFTVYDDCAAIELEKHPKVSEISYALSPRALELDNFFSPSPLPQGYPTGMFEYWNAKFGDKVKHVGTLYPNVPAALSSFIGIREAARSVGWVFEYQRKYAPTEQNFTADVVRMQRQGIEIIYLGTSEIQQVAQIKRQADEQDYHPLFISGLAYAEDFVELVGGPEHAEGVLGSNLYTLFFNEDDARNIPSVALFQHWLGRVAPEAPVNLFAMYSWTAAHLFVQALTAAGPRATRESLQAQLRKIHSFDADGMLPDRDPAGKKASVCYVLFEYRNGAFRRVDTPRAGYRCDGHYYNYEG